MPETRLMHIVVDHDSICCSPATVLSKAGYRVEHWADGEAFLRGADAARPACVLLDLRLPGLDAIEVQTRMPAAGLDFPVILMTERGDIAMAVQAIKAGAADILENPCDGEQLLRSVEGAFHQMTGRQAHRERAQWAHTQLAKLNDRERDVLDRLACGYPNTAIAGNLGVSLRAVEGYRDNVVTKLDLGNFGDALRVAFAAGWGSKPGYHIH